MPRTQPRTVGGLLREARGEDMSMREAARALGISDRMYKQWETDYAVPAVERASRIAVFCGVSRADVLALLGAITPEEADVLRTLDSRPSSAEAPQTGSVEGRDMPWLRGRLSNRLTVAA